MSVDFFDQIDSDRRLLAPVSPFWTLDFEDEKAVLEWLNKAYDALVDNAQDRVWQQRKNLAAFRGLHFQGQDARTRELRSQTGIPLTKSPRIIVNHLYDMVLQHVSRLTKYRPATSVVPPLSGEHDDKVLAEVAEMIQEAIFYFNDADEKLREAQLYKKVLGEHYLGAEFNKDIGDVHPDYLKAQKKAMKKGEAVRLPLLGKDGEQVNGVDGKPIFIDEPVRIGEVEFKHFLAYDVLLQRKPQYKQVEYAFWHEIVDADEAKADFPDKANKIKVNENSTYFDSESLEERRMQNQVLKIHFWHRHTKHLASGRYVCFTKDVLLKNRTLPHSHGDFPWVRFTDVDIPGHLNAISAMEFGRPLSNQYNNLTSMVLRNQSLCAHPKWFAPKNSVKIESLGNDTTIVQYQGPTPPVLAQANPTPNEVFAFRKELKEETQQIMGVYGVSRGEPPPGINAGVALQFLDEQENERANIDVAKHNKAIRELSLKSLSLAGDNYDVSDGRLEKLLGKQRAASLKYFDLSRLGDIKDIKVQNSSALPQQKAARVQTIMDYAKQFPTLFSEEQVIDLLELGESKKFMDASTVAVNAAEEENTEILQSGQTQDPEEWENHLTHYKIHMRELNSKYYKSSAPKEVREALIDHVRATEMFLWFAGEKNPMYLQMIAEQFPTFPIFFVPSQEPPPPEVMENPGMPMEAMQMPPEAMGPPEGPFPPQPEMMPAEAAQFPPEAQLPEGLENAMTAPEPPPLL